MSESQFKGELNLPGRFLKKVAGTACPVLPDPHSQQGKPGKPGKRTEKPAHRERETGTPREGKTVTVSGKIG